MQVLHRRKENANFFISEERKSQWMKNRIYLVQENCAPCFLYVLHCLYVDDGLNGYQGICGD